MADFRQLALEFVLADDEAKLTSIAQQAASGASLGNIRESILLTGGRDPKWTGQLEPGGTMGRGGTALDAREQQR